MRRKSVSRMSTTRQTATNSSLRAHEIRARPPVARQRRRRDLRHAHRLTVRLDFRADRGDVAVLLAQLVPGGLPHEEKMSHYSAAAYTGTTSRIVEPWSSCSTVRAAPSVRARSSSTSIDRRRRSLGASSEISTTSACGSPRVICTANVCGGPRRIAPSSASRTIWYSAACARSPRPSAGATSSVTWMPCSMPLSCASALTALEKPWSRSTTGSRLNERSRSSPIVVRVRVSALSRISSARAGSPRRTKSRAASSRSAIPASDCTGPSCRNSAMRRRSSCSAARTCSVRSSVNDRLAERDCDRVRARVGLELREDVPHVALHRLLADEELRRDVRIRHAVGEQLQDLALAAGEHVVLVTAGEERRHERRVDVALAGGDLLDRAQQGRVRRLLEDVALRAGLEPAAEQAALAVGGEDEDGAVRHLLGQELRRF